MISNIHFWKLVYPVRAAILLALGLGCFGTPLVIKANDGSPIRFDEASFSLYVLSRGQGVPDATWAALEEFRKALAGWKAEGLVVHARESIIGLEGERRLCAEFIDETAARAAWKDVEALISGVDLVNLRAESCPP